MATSKSSGGEGQPLISAESAAAATTAGVALINASADKITKARSDGPLTFRTLGFIGGWAMLISNGMGISDRFFSFNWDGALTAFYGILFGILIIMLEAPSIWCCKAGRLTSRVRYYAKFLEYTWGRGMLFFFVGSLQVTNFNMLDWAVGGFMMFVGITAIAVGIATASDLRIFKHSIKDEEDLKAKWDQYDADGNGSLDVKELSLFISEAGVTMNRNEIASTFLALDRNFDEKITYEEFYYWWTASSERGGESGFSV